MVCLSVNEFLKDNALWLALGVVGVIILVVLIIFLSGLKRKKQISHFDVYEKIVVALGGFPNIGSVSSRGSRLTVVLQDKHLLDEEKIKDLGVSSLIKMSAKVILVIGQEAGDIVKYINQNKK